MAHFIQLQEADAKQGNMTRVNVASIVTYYAHSTPHVTSNGNTTVTFAKGYSIAVSETVDEIDALIRNTGADNWSAPRL